MSYSTPAFTLRERDLIPEDIAVDPATRDFFVSGVRKSKIVRIDRAGMSTDFAKADGRFSRCEWTLDAASFGPQTAGCRTVSTFDLDSGALRQRIQSPVKGPLGDLTISTAGEIFVSEGMRGAVLRLRPGDRNGLYMYRDSFLAVQNGTRPERIIRFSLDLRKQEILEANTPELGEPTHGYAGGRHLLLRRILLHPDILLPS